MEQGDLAEYGDRLYAMKDELTERLERISLNVRRTLDSDSKERAQEIKDHDVVDALGNEARVELAEIDAALRRMSNGSFGICVLCHQPIVEGRLAARPQSSKCIECENDVLGINASDGL